MAANATSGKCLGVYRGHDGTVYSLDIYWKFGEPDDHEVSKKQVSPTQKSNISLFTGNIEYSYSKGSHDQNIIVWDFVNDIDMKIKVI